MPKLGENHLPKLVKICTTTGTGLEVHAQLDDNLYPTGIQVTDEQFNAIAIERCRFHGEWNYRIVPRKTV